MPLRGGTAAGAVIAAGLQRLALAVAMTLPTRVAAQPAWLQRLDGVLQVAERRCARRRVRRSDGQARSALILSAKVPPRLLPPCSRSILMFAPMPVRWSFFELTFA